MVREPGAGFFAAWGRRALIYYRLPGVASPSMKPSLSLQLKRSAVLEATSRFHTANPRVFGSALRGDDTEGSDLDLLVDPLPGTTLFALGGLQLELEELLGIPVDLLTPGDLSAKFREQVVSEALPI